MKIRILERGDNFLRLEIEGEGHTLCNLLQRSLLEDEDVEIGGYDLAHPLVSKAVLFVKTKEGSPEEALKRAIERIKRTNKAFQEALSIAFGEGAEVASSEDKGSSSES
ncbi:DNA-directed RNA polymerase subunit L [Candidatus Bathyarchaeota archaeon]|nr:MAG: DNA-directed RNA polymerase subunit L [Candidatus Bathyarchaeota archaeon]HDI42531.1 DNA-directed RNA polymerase subunit L [Candidatus Bathyarchaeota archaeon]